ncbi:MAG: hypothetical protein CMJ77_05210 [Planctomycetaceae bacterium]|nr:hypothetical protein [Planctomycetaceae bacterium]
MPEHWLYQDTGMKKGDTIAGLVGWQWHGRPARELPGLEVLAEGPIMPKNSQYHPHTATIYNGPQGNFVFNAGEIWWAQGLTPPPGHILPAHRYAKSQGPDSQVQRMMTNLLMQFVS